MVDLTSQFFTILTAVGEAKQANADALGIPWKLTHLGVGDANGSDPTPDRLQTRLINEQRRAPLNQLKIDPVNPAVIIAEQVIPADVGGWWVREIGLYDGDGDLIAVANCAPSFKPVLAQGSGRTQVVRINFVVSSTANVELKIDPSVVLATRKYVDLKVQEELSKNDFKHSVRAATVKPITLHGTQSLDDIVLIAGDRVLVKDQTDAKENGLYVVAEQKWNRSADADSNLKVTPGLFVHIEQGTSQHDSLWHLASNAPIKLGTTPLAFEMIAGRPGAAPGTFRSLSVDEFGRVIGGTNPKTLAEYEIEIASQDDALAERDFDNTRPMSALRVFQFFNKRIFQASETALGWVKIATQQQVNQGTEDIRVITANTLRAGFVLFWPGSGNGYISFPSWLGGLIIQWGAIGSSLDDVVTVLPVTFPRSFMRVLACNDYTHNSNAIGFVSASPRDKGSFISKGSSPTLGASFIAIGY